MIDGVKNSNTPDLNTVLGYEDELGLNLSKEQSAKTGEEKW